MRVAGKAGPIAKVLYQNRQMGALQTHKEAYCPTISSTY